MVHEYPEWNVNDAKSGLYTVGHRVYYANSNGTESVYEVTSQYAGGLRTPDVEIGWKYVYTVIYDWSTYGVYKIGSVVYFNGMKYVATSRYRGGNQPPNEELDTDGVRTWIINYEDGKTPKSVFFYRKTFGFKTLDEAYPFSNYLEDISWDTVPMNQEGQISYGYDRFSSYRNLNADGEWRSGTWQRSKEQSYINSIMEAHPYHDIYVLGEVDANDSSVFNFYENAKHKSELKDKLFPFLNLNLPFQQAPSGSFVPKRNIPYYDSYSLEYLVDAGASFSLLNNGVSIEYYPDIQSNNFEIICPEYYKARVKFDSFYFLYGHSTRAISKITPIYCYASEVSVSYSLQTGQLTGSTKMQIYVEPFNTCVDNVSITFHFKISVINCWETSQPLNSQNEDNQVNLQHGVDCSDEIVYYVNRTYEYNENTRNASPNFSPLFLGQPNKLVPNPNYDPNCVPDFSNPSQPIYCPSEFMTVPDTNYADTSIEFASFIPTTGTANVKLIGWTIN